MIEVIRNEKPKANKDHVCQFCEETIKKGEVYERQINKYDGELYVWKCHVSCSQLTSKLDMFDYDDGNGIDEDCFSECVDAAYAGIASEEQQEKDRFSWAEELQFVKDYYLKEE